MILLKGIGALRYAGSLATRSTIYAPLFTRRTPHELRGFVTGSPGVRCRFVDGSFGLREWPVSFVLLNIVASFQRFLFSDLREVIPAHGMRRREKLHDADEGSMERGEIRWAGGRANRPNLLSSFRISQFHFCVTGGAVRVERRWMRVRSSVLKSVKERLWDKSTTRVWKRPAATKCAPLSPAFPR